MFKSTNVAARVPRRCSWKSLYSHMVQQARGRDGRSRSDPIGSQMKGFVTSMDARASRRWTRRALVVDATIPRRQPKGKKRVEGTGRSIQAKVVVCRHNQPCTSTPRGSTLMKIPGRSTPSCESGAVLRGGLGRLRDVEANVLVRQVDDCAGDVVATACREMKTGQAAVGGAGWA
eukprot:1644622-Pleurochrysis_carterae.AAC.1